MRKAIELEKLAIATTNDPRWPSIVARDKSADGTFYYAVKSPGVYCRPSYAARLTLLENVEFFKTTAGRSKLDFALASVVSYQANSSHLLTRTGLNRGFLREGSGAAVRKTVEGFALRRKVRSPCR
jgi:hypothetical protein